MYWNENPVSMHLSDRLSKLEEELDQLINIQERIKEQSKGNSTPILLQLKQDRPFDLHRPCVNGIASTTKTSSNYHAVTQCAYSSAPLADITKFLQHINVNLSKGTQAISKIARSNLQKPSSDHENKNYHENCAKKEEDSNDNIATKSCRSGKKFNEDALFKELREEKDKRVRAENQTKHLKDELKKTKCELLQSANQTIQQLEYKFKDALEKLEVAKKKLEEREQELHRYEYLWPYKYETVCKQLQDEQVKRHETERNVKELQETLQKTFLNTKEYISLQETSSWLKEQNDRLIGLTKRLKTEIENKSDEISKKSGLIDHNLLKIKQLTSLCEKLRDFLIVIKHKNLATEEELKQNQMRNQTLTDKLLEAQSTSDQLKKLHLEDKMKEQKLSELIETINSTNCALQRRLDEMSEIMRQQNCLISQQSDTINIREEELKLAHEHYKVQSKRIEELVEKNEPTGFRMKNTQLLSEIARLELEIKTQKENTLIKEKMLESNLQTIFQLKHTLEKKEEDLFHERRELAEKERKLTIEQTANEQLQSKIKSLLNRKEELKIKVIELEEELENQISSDHSKRLEQIEKQVREKQKEWEELKENLMKEKIDAIQSLKRAEDKCSREKNEYDKNLAVQQQKVNELATKLTEKDKQLKETTEHISKLSKELQETAGNAKKAKIAFEEKLHSACEAWQNTIQLLQN